MVEPELEGEPCQRFRPYHPVDRLVIFLAKDQPFQPSWPHNVVQAVVEVITEAKVPQVRQSVAVTGAAQHGGWEFPRQGKGMNAGHAGTDVVLAGQRAALGADDVRNIGPQLPGGAVFDSQVQRGCTAARRAEG